MSFFRLSLVTLASFIAFTLSGETQRSQAPSGPNPEPTSTDLVFVQAPVFAAGDVRGRFPQGSRLARLSAPGREVENLTPDFFAVADPQISSDGKRVLFAAQEREGATWAVWEMNTDGSGKRRVTAMERDCVRPAYLARDHITFSCSTPAGWQVHVAKRNGSDAHPITFGPGNFLVETVLRDGRILVSADYPLRAEAAATGSRELYVLRHDGTALASLRCDHEHRAARSDAVEMADGSVVFIKANVPGSSPGGTLAWIQRGELHNSPLGDPAAVSGTPRPLADGRLIVARQSGTPRFDLYALDEARGTAELVFRDPQYSSLQPVAVKPQPVPRWYWSTASASDPAGYFIGIDSYHAAEMAGGRISTRIAAVRVIALDAQTNREIVLGQAPVEEDGSFYIAVPPDRPVRFELLDNGQQVIRAQHSWIWARAGEERGCVGCHEDKGVTPPNRWPLTLRRFDTPTPLGVTLPPRKAH